MSSGVTAACDSTVTVLLLSHVLPRILSSLPFLFPENHNLYSFIFFSHRKTFVSYLQTIGFMGWNFSSISLKL